MFLNKLSEMNMKIESKYVFKWLQLTFINASLSNPIWNVFYFYIHFEKRFAKWGYLRNSLSSFKHHNVRDIRFCPKLLFSFLPQTSHSLSLVSYKKSYLVCAQLTNFWIFTQPIHIFFKVQNWDTQKRPETAVSY